MKIAPFIIAFTLFALLSGCAVDKKELLNNQGKEAVVSMDTAITEYLENIDIPPPTGVKTFAAYDLFGVSENGNEKVAYLWALIETYGVDPSVGIGPRSGSSVPLALFLMEENGNYSVIGHHQPGDGSCWWPDVKEIFPEEYHERILHYGSYGKGKDLEQMIREKVDNYLKEFYHPLPFPGEQVREIKSVGDNFILIERVTSNDHNYYLDHPSFNGIKNIVSFIETAKFIEYKDGELRFTARGGSDTGNFQFPYQLIYNPNTEELTRDDLFLTLNEQEQISFGKNSWKRILSSFKVEDSSLAFDFKPKAGEVLAGGCSLPYTTVHYNEKSTDLVFNFFNVELADTLKENMIVKSPGLEHVKELRFEQLSGWLGDNQSGSQMPIVRLRITLEGRPLYNVRASHSEGTGYEETDRCTIIFR